MANTNDHDHDIQSALANRCALTLTGRVQGIGLRPAVARFAEQLSLAGYVDNTRDGVEIHVEGSAPNVERFERELSAHLPASAEISSLRSIRAAAAGRDAFVVGQMSDLPIRDENAVLSARVPPDVMVCDQCLAEVHDAADRRHGYPFVSCTDYGPRYSIIENMPYEREETSMAAVGDAIAGRAQPWIVATHDLV